MTNKIIATLISAITFFMLTIYIPNAFAEITGFRQGNIDLSIGIAIEDILADSNVETFVPIDIGFQELVIDDNNIVKNYEFKYLEHNRLDKNINLNALNLIHLITGIPVGGKHGRGIALLDREDKLIAVIANLKPFIHINFETLSLTRIGTDIGTELILLTPDSYGSVEVNLVLGSNTQTLLNFALELKKELPIGPLDRFTVDAEVDLPLAGANDSEGFIEFGTQIDLNSKSSNPGLSAQFKAGVHFTNFNPASISPYASFGLKVRSFKTIFSRGEK